MDLDVSAFNLEQPAEAQGSSQEGSGPEDFSDAYDKSLNAALLNGNTKEEDKGSQVLAFRKKAPVADEGHQNAMRVLYTANREAPAKKVKKPKVAHEEEAY